MGTLSLCVRSLCFYLTILVIKVRCCDVPGRPGEYCSDDAFLKGVGSGQGLLFKSCRRCCPTAESERPLPRGVSHRHLLMLLQGSTDLDHIQIIKKVGGKLTDSYLDEGRCYFFFFPITRQCLTTHIGFILDKSIGTNCPKRVENARILIANTCTLFTPMDSRIGSKRGACSYGY